MALQRRFSRLYQLPLFKGVDDLEALGSVSVGVVGLGATGSTTLDLLARYGFRNFVLIDGDIVDESNIPRQIYTTDDLGEPKVKRAREHVMAIEPEARATAYFRTLNAGNIDEMLAGADIIIDGTDNLPTRYVINEYAVKTGIPWIYQGALGMGATMMVVVPGKTPCLRCLFPHSPPSESERTCATEGVSPSAVRVVTALTAQKAVELALGRKIPHGIYSVDMGLKEPVHFTRVQRSSECPVCAMGKYKALSSHDPGGGVHRICRGEFVVNIPTKDMKPIDNVQRMLESLKFPPTVFRRNNHAIVFAIEGVEFTYLTSGRILVRAVEDSGDGSEDVGRGVKGDKIEERIKMLLREYLGLVIQ